MIQRFKSDTYYFQLEMLDSIFLFVCSVATLKDVVSQKEKIALFFYSTTTFCSLFRLDDVMIAIVRCKFTDACSHAFFRRSALSAIT